MSEDIKKSKKKEKPKKKEKSLFTKKSDAGKGDSPRPTGISPEEWAERWEAIFGKKKLKKENKNARERSKKTST